MSVKRKKLNMCRSNLRFQIDNCLRTYEAFIAEDKNKITGTLLESIDILQYNVIVRYLG